MGSNLDLYWEYNEASGANPPTSILEANERYLSDDFQILDMDGNAQMNKPQYQGMVQMLLSAFTDFKSIISDTYQEGDQVFISSHFEGLHTGDLDLSAMGMGLIPASGKKIIWPEASTKWSFRDGKITSIQANDDAGGIGPFLAELGVTPPSA